MEASFMLVGVEFSSLKPLHGISTEFSIVCVGEANG
jgi:hypothetical protein